MSYDDNGGNAGMVDLSLAHFDIGSRGLEMAAMLRSMKDLNPNMVTVGSCWGVPGWMQTDGILVGAGSNTLNHSYSEQYGDYFVKYIQAFEAAGAHIDAITIQNEPLNNNSGMPSMVIESVESGQLIHDFVGPALRRAGLETEIWAYDHNTGKPLVEQMTCSHLLTISKTGRTTLRQSWTWRRNMSTLRRGIATPTPWTGLS
jgi:glucosylceramidase